MNTRVTSIILGGGQGKRLFPLTSYRSKPAVPIGTKYRLVDIPISNCINSEMRRIFVLTQFNSASLHQHIHRTYPYEHFNKTSVELLAAQQTTESLDWFQGTADAVRKNLSHYRLEGTKTVLVLSGDHLYRMNYQEIIRYHYEKNADVTIATVPVGKKDVGGFGIMQISNDGQIHSFLEKPSPSEKIDSFVVPPNIRSLYGLKGRGDLYLASMGVYVFNPKVLIEVLKGREADFGKEVIPKAIRKSKVYGYVFNGYWRDIGTIDSFYEASIDLTKTSPPFNFDSWEGRIFTRPRFLPPTRILSTELNQVLLPEGCSLEGSFIEESVIGLRSIIRKGTVIRRSVLMGNDYYDPPSAKVRYSLGVGKNCRIENCIIDKNVCIGDKVSITNSRRVKEEDGHNYFIRDGIVIVPKGAVIEAGTKI